MELIAIFLSLGAFVISVTSFYYAHLRRSKVVLEVDEDQGVFSGGSAWRSLVPINYKIILPLFVVNKGGSTGTLEDFKIKIENTTDKILLKGSNLCFEESHRGHRNLPHRLSIKEGEIIPLFVEFSLKIKDIDRVNDKNILYLAGLVKELKKAKIVMTYRTRWPVKYHRQDISSELFYEIIRKDLKKTWEKDERIENKEITKEGVEILDKG